MFELKKVTIIITEKCNLNCAHCYIKAGKNIDKEIGFDEVKNALEQLYYMGVVEIEFSGGEPFCREDFLDILDLANDMGFALKIVTNGTLLDEMKVKNLAKLSMRSIQVSLDGLPSNHEWMRGRNTFEKCVNAIKLLKAAGIFTKVRVTVTKKSLPDVEGLAEMCAELNVDEFALSEFTPLGRGIWYKSELALDKNDKKRFNELFQYIKRKYAHLMAIEGGPYGCFERGEALKNQNVDTNGRSILCGAIRGDWLQIMPDGEVTPCDLILFQAGNIRFQRLEDIWNNSPAFNAFRNFNPENLTGACGDCQYKISCGGCRALAFLFNGDFYAEDPMCIRAQRNLT